MPTYPSPIDRADFHDVDVAPPPPVSPVLPCNDARPECSLQKLWLLPSSGGGDSSFTVAAGHGTLQKGAAGRYHFAPTVDHPNIHWELSGQAHVASATLELFRHDDASGAPCWTKTITWDGAAAGAASTPFDDLTSSVAGAATTDHAPTVVITPAYIAAEFPDDVLTVEHSPYKLKMTITPMVGAKTKVDVRWIYVEVIAANLRVELGPRAVVPRGPRFSATPLADTPTEQQDFAARNLEVYDLIAAQLAASPAIDEATQANIEVRLPSNLFGRSIPEWYNNTFYAAYEEMWGDGPLIPLVARIGILAANGAATDSAPKALGNACFLWDWVGAPLDTSRFDGHDKVRTFVEAAVDYKRGDHAHGRDNCHVDHGGKRGAAATSKHFEPVPAADPQAANGYVKASGAAIANKIPFHSKLAANRDWAAVSYARTEGYGAGQTGVLFRPSRMAGDGYKLTVYLAKPLSALDVALSTPKQVAQAAGELPRATTGLFRVVRQIVVAKHWRKSGAVGQGSFAWANVQALLRRAGVHLVPPAAVSNIAQVDYERAFQDYAMSGPFQIVAALLPHNQQYAGNHGVTFHPFQTYFTAVKARVSRCKAHVIRTAGKSPSSSTMLARQEEILGLLSGADADEELLLTNPADLAKDDDAATWSVLERVGLSGFTAKIAAGKYKDRCQSWSATVLQHVCDKLTDRDLPGLHVFQFDYSDNFDHYWAAAEAYKSPTNRTTCPKCAGALNNASVKGRECSACHAPIRDNASIISYYPWSRYQSGTNVVEWIRSMAGKAFGATPEVSTAHEIGHHLCMPHALPLTEGKGEHPRYHDHGDWCCLMSYNLFKAAELHLCGFCMLRISGWSAGPTPISATGPLETLALANPSAAADDPMLLAVDPDLSRILRGFSKTQMATNREWAKGRMDAARATATALDAADSATVALHNKADANRA